jgi:hypothetical protein
VGVRVATWSAWAALVALLCAASAQAAFPGQNGKIAFSGTVAGQTGIHAINPDGTGVAMLAGLARNGISPAWSPSGSRIAYEVGGILTAANADGSNAQFWYDSGTRMFAIDWAPDETRLALTEGPVGPDFDNTLLHWVAARPEPPGQVINLDVQPAAAAWSPDGTRVAFVDGWEIAVGGVQTVAPDGTGLTTVPNTQGLTFTNYFSNGAVDWSPDGQRLAFSGQQGGDAGIFTVSLDGSGLTRVTTAPAGLADAAPAWSPDGSKLAFVRWPDDSPSGPRRLFVVDSAGGVPTQLPAAGDSVSPNQIDWQPLPVNGYPRPLAASPVLVSLVLAYPKCTSPNRVHGPPLEHPSCNPVSLSSPHLHVGTFDSNAVAANFRGSVRLGVAVGNPATTTDEADVSVKVSLTDIRCNGGAPSQPCGDPNHMAGDDYTGELEPALSLRITDKDNTPNPGGPGAATVQDMTVSFAVDCIGTSSINLGSDCSTTTSIDALIPGAVKEKKRTVWALGPIEVLDGGPDGDADTPEGDVVFLRQGVFVP